MSPAVSLLPLLLALGVGAWRREARWGLAAGSALGFLLLAWPDHGWMSVAVAPVEGVRRGLLGRLAVDGNAHVLFLVTLVGGFVRLLEASGAAAGLLRPLLPWLSVPRRVEAATWLAGVVLFFSDLGSVLVLGPLARPAYDQAGLPRERLAWMVDATAAPVSVLVPFITWGIYIAGLLEAARPEVSGFSLLLAALPWQLYPWLSLLFALGMVLVGRPFGPMASASPAARAPERTQDGPGPGPALAAFTALLVGLSWGVGLTVAEGGKLTGEGLRTGLGLGYLLATATLGLALRRSLAEVLRWFQQGCANALPLLVLLVLAWSLADVSVRLGLATLLTTLVQQGWPIQTAPFLLFAASAAVSFLSGTSWGTFAVFLPVAVTLGQGEGAQGAALIGAVLSGGVVGDQASPLSDTTLLSAAASGCGAPAHVRTQLPYVLTVGGIVGIGFLAGGWGGLAAAWALGLVGLGGSLAVSRRWGRSEA